MVVREREVKLIATYFTQLHQIPENDMWWGEGFTDWINVKKAKPLFKGHYQPRVPLNRNYYDQSEISILRSQIDLARKYGVFGFCHYHYWFDGKQLLETPTNIMLDNPDLDFPFCLSWANETWSRQWDGLDHDILIQQTHPPTIESWKKHFDYLIRAWKDKRAIKIDGKPVFIIYRPKRIHRLNEMIKYWRELAVKEGLKGLYIIYQAHHDIPSKYLVEFDAQFLFQPFNAINYNRAKTKLYKKIIIGLSEKIRKYLLNILGISDSNTEYHKWSYDDVWELILKQKVNQNIISYKGSFSDWDNTARYGDRATIADGACPERFEYWFGKLVNNVVKDNNPNKLIFINAWNEWAEGAYLEPDEINQYQYLEAIKRVLK